MKNTNEINEIDWYGEDFYHCGRATRPGFLIISVSPALNAALMESIHDPIWTKISNLHSVLWIRCMDERINA
jgi:hypothetical protein